MLNLTTYELLPHIPVADSVAACVCPCFTYARMIPLLQEVNQPWNKGADILGFYVCCCLLTGRALTPTYTTFITIG